MKYCDACHSAYPDDFSICPRDKGPLRHASELLPGMVLRGKYEVLEKIGSGGMASVYRARHLAFGEVVAIKVVAGKLAHDETFLRRFRNEAVVTRRLQHPNAVHVEDFDTTEDGRPFIVMEFVHGRNLRDVIRQDAPLHPRRAVRITRQVASALAAAHAFGIVHRDIKPDNILLARGGDGLDLAKVLDFGIAKVKETVLGEEAYTPTRTGMVVGTPQYVSPEQAMGKRGEEIDGRSDLYSLGVVLYEMLTGRLPFASDTAMGMILHHLQTAPTPPHLARPDLGIAAPLSDLLMMALQKDPGHRFATAEDMVAALDALEPDLPALPADAFAAVAEASPLRTPTPTSSVPPSTPRPSPVPRSTPLPSVATPPGAPPTVLGAAAAEAADIAERPTRMFPGGEGQAVTAIGPGTTMAGGPQPVPPGGTATPLPPLPPPPPARARHEGRGWFRRTWPWMALAALLVIVFSDESRSRRSDRGAAAPEASASASPEAPDDSDLQDGVERLLGTARATREANLDVDVEEGVVVLSGEVEDPSVAQVAEALAESYPGVKGVRNTITVTAPEVADRAERPETPGGPKIIVPPILPMGRGGSPPSPGTPQHEALTDLLRDGRKALEKNEVEEALAIYGAALTIDGRNPEALHGMQEAARRMRERARHFRFKWTPPSEWPFTGGTPPVPPAPGRPAPRPSARPQPQPE